MPAQLAMTPMDLEQIGRHIDLFCAAGRPQDALESVDVTTTLLLGCLALFTADVLMGMGAWAEREGAA